MSKSNNKIKIIIEEQTSTGDVVTRNVVNEFDLKRPTHIKDLGLNHKEQINLLQNVLDLLIKKQSVLIEGESTCSKCGRKTMKSGTIKSEFHSVFTDHEVEMQRRVCKCGWQNPSSVRSRFGNSSHPDLLEMQCKEGAQKSYQKTEETLERRCCEHRPVNNHSRIERTVNKVGNILSNLKDPDKVNPEKPAEYLIAQADGAHIPSKDKKRSIEGLITKIYRPESLVETDKNHTKIEDKAYAVSVLSDKHKTIKTHVLYAAKSQGLTPETTVIALADGAKNCWSILESLKEHCKEFIGILDWFHIGKRFKNVEQQLPPEDHEELERAKWSLWHGNTEKCLSKLQVLLKNQYSEKAKKKLEQLYKYIKRNSKYIIDYEKQSQIKFPYTSSAIESSVDSVVNERHARKQKMQWTRKGAHALLQIRASLANNTWNKDWSSVLPVLLNG